MRQKVLEIINSIRTSKNLPALDALKDSDTLLFDMQLTYGIDIFEDGLVNTVGEIYAKLSE